MDDSTWNMWVGRRAIGVLFATIGVMPIEASATAIAQSLFGSGAVTLTGLPGGSCGAFVQGALETNVTEFASTNVLRFGSGGCDQAGPELSLSYENLLVTSTAYAGDLTKLSPPPERYFAIGQSRSIGVGDGISKFPLSGKAGDQIAYDVSFVYSLLASVDGENPPESPPYFTGTELALSQAGFTLTLLRLDGSGLGGNFVDAANFGRQIVVNWNRWSGGELGAITSAESISRSGSFVLPVDGNYRLDVARRVDATAFSSQAVAEPGSLALLGLGLAGLGLSRRRKAA